MRYVKIPNLENPVSVIGLGTASNAFTPNNYERAKESLDSFLKVGGNRVDTALGTLNVELNLEEMDFLDLTSQDGVVAQ